MCAAIVSPVSIRFPTQLVDVLLGRLPKDALPTDVFIYISNAVGDQIVNLKQHDNYKAFENKQINTSIATSALSFNAPKLYVKTAKETSFTNNFFFKMATATEFNKHQHYTFRVPVAYVTPTTTPKAKNEVIVMIEDENVKNAMIRLDNVVFLAMEFLMLATIVKFDFRHCKDDKELITGLFQTISPEHYEQMLEKLDSRYFQFMSNPPTWRKYGSNGNFIIDLNGDVNAEDEDFNIRPLEVTLFNLIRSILVTKKAEIKKQGTLVNDIFVKLFDGKTDNYYYKFIRTNSPDNDIVPKSKLTKYIVQNKNGEKTIKDSSDIRLQFNVIIPGNKQLPAFMITKFIPHVEEQAKGKRKTQSKTQSNAQPRIPMKTQDFLKFLTIIGAEETLPYVYYKGSIWCAYRIDLTKFNMSQAHNSWAIALHDLQQTTKKSDDDFAIDVYEDADSDDENAADSNEIPVDKSDASDASDKNDEEETAETAENVETAETAENDEETAASPKKQRNATTAATASPKKQRNATTASAAPPKKQRNATTASAASPKKQPKKQQVEDGDDIDDLVEELDN